jgi:hypothetical protein
MNQIPSLIQCSDGKWLATTSAEDPMAVGVFGDTAEEARQRLVEAVVRRLELYEQVKGDPKPSSVRRGHRSERGRV